jgi:hypothetical protein
MTTEAPNFILHSEKFLGLARRLSEFGVSFYGHDYSARGAWSVVAGTERDRFQFRWQGRELQFTISKGIISESGRDWQMIRTLNLRYPEAVSAMEIFLHETFAA